MALETFKTAQKVVTTSGTPEQLPAIIIDQSASCAIKAKVANTGLITLGETSAEALNSGTDYYSLSPGEILGGVEVSNIGKIWIDAAVSGEGVEIIIA